MISRQSGAQVWSRQCGPGADLAGSVPARRRLPESTASETTYCVILLSLGMLPDVPLGLVSTTSILRCLVQISRAGVDTWAARGSASLQKAEIGIIGGSGLYA